MTAGLFAFLAAAGFGVGVLSGFFGVGGGAFLVPLLVRVAGLDWDAAIGLSLTQMIATSALGAWKRWRQGEVHAGLAKGAIAGAIPGTALGRWAVAALKGAGEVNLAGRTVDAVNAALTLTFVTAVGFMAVRMIRPSTTAGGSNPSAPVPFGEAVLTGFAVGLTSALLGIGGGFVFVPIAVERFGLPVAFAVGTSLFQMPVTATAGALLYGFNTEIPYAWLIPLLAGSFAGVWPAIALSRRFDNKQYRKYMGYTLLATTIYMAATYGQGKTRPIPENPDRPAASEAVDPRGESQSGDEEKVH